MRAASRTGTMPRMEVFELRYPGTWLDGLADGDGHQVQSLLFLLEGHLAEAALGLTFFEQARSRPRDKLSGTRRSEAVRSVVTQMERQLAGNLTAEQRFEAMTGLNDAADLQVRRQEWAAGVIPDTYLDRLPFFYAHAVLFALDGIGKILAVLADMSGLPAGVAAASSAYEAALPDLVSVRNSAHHTEDRARGLKNGARPITLQPVNNQMIDAPNGVLVLSSLNGNRLGYTAADGHHREIEMSTASVKAAQAAIQQVLDALSWRGPARTVPR
jgi:hypothetical protein